MQDDEVQRRSTVLEVHLPQPSTWLRCVLLAATFISSPAYAACDMVAVKRQIDTILDRDKDKAARFHHEISDGSDSLTVMESLVSPAMQDMIDTCRYQASEYLTKRGFPPGGH